MSQEQSQIYDAYYYRTGCGRPYQRDEQWMRFFDGIADRIIRDINPKTVLDAGCAMGFLVEALRNRGVEAYGIDISEYAIQSAHESIRPFCWVGSIAEPFPQKYDLIVTIEVLEHMPKEQAEKAIENFAHYTDQVLFSSGDEDLREVTHINLHPAEYWAALFAGQGFFRDVDFDATFLTPWSVRFCRSNAPVHRVIMDYERQIARLIKENDALRQVNLDQKQQLGQHDSELQMMHAKLGLIYDNKTYQVARRMRMLVPEGSRREKWIRSLWNGLARIKHRRDIGDRS